MGQSLSGALKQTFSKVINVSLATIISVSGLAVATPLMFPASAAALGATLYVDDSWAGTTPGTDPDGAGPATNFGTDSFSTIQAAVNAASSTGDVIDVYPGNYTEGVTSVDYFGAPGGQNFGLLIYKDNLTIQGVTAGGAPITNSHSTQATITAQYQAGFGAQNFVSGNNVSILGLKFTPLASGNNKTLELIGDNFTLKNSTIDNSGSLTPITLYASQFSDVLSHDVESFLIQGNQFIAPSFASSLVIMASGMGNGGSAASNRMLSNNEFVGSAGVSGARGFRIRGQQPGIGELPFTAGPVRLSGNTFSNLDTPVNTIGFMSQDLDWSSVLANNTFVGGAALTFAGSTATARSTNLDDGAGVLVPDIRITRQVSTSVTRASSGDTVRATAGDYSSVGTINITQPLTLLGVQADVAAASTSTGTARSGSESTLSRLFITSGNVSVNGFSFNSASTSGQVQVLSASTLVGISVKNNIFNGYDNVALPTNAAGNIVIQSNLFTNPSPSAEAIQIKTSNNTGDCNGTQVLNNVFNAATTNGAADINLSCTGSSSTNVTVSGNRSENATDPNGPNMVAFSGVTGNITVSNNTATTSGSQVLFFGSVSGTALITGNNFTNGGGSAVSIHGGDNFARVNDPHNTGAFTITNNSFVNNSFGIRVANGALSGSGTVNGSLNWWGSSSPAFPSLVTSGVTHDPYFIDAAMTIRSDNKVVPDGSGNATVNPTTPEVVVSSPSQPLNLTVASGTNNATINFDALVTNGTGTIPQTSVHTSSVDMSIPASTTVTASDTSWDGVITAPTVVSNISVPAPSGTTTQVATAIEVGAGNINLTFDKAVRLLIQHQAGKLIGFVRNGNFTQITNVCSADTQASGDALVAGGDCYINVGSDMVVWTKHFTTFVAYSQTATPGAPAATTTSSTSSTKKSTTQSTTQDTTTPTVLGSNNTTEAAQNNSATTTVTTALAIQPTGHGKFLGLQWYLWLVGLAVLAGAAYGVYRFADTTERR